MRGRYPVIGGAAVRYRRRVSQPTCLIVNPASGGGIRRARLDALVARAEAVCGPLSVATTHAPGDAAELAFRAAREGCRRLLVAGGDGTVGEVVGGLMRAGLPRPRLALLPIGSGCDLARSLGIPRRLDAALAIAAADVVRPLDVARIVARDRSGAPIERHFANEASAGISGDTVARVAARRSPLGPRIAFLAAALAALTRHRPFEAALEVDGARVYEGPISLCVVANGCYFGAGMRVAPGAAFDDGRLEIVLARGLARGEIARQLPSFYLGRHGRHPAVSFHSARHVELLPKAGGAAAEAAVEVDGEGGFALPFRVECLPAALEIATPLATARCSPAPERAFPAETSRALRPVARPVALFEEKN